jgi:magnesium transporter
MLRRIGTCRKKVMGLLRLMGNKADVVKGFAKRCNENWRVAPTSDIVRPSSLTVRLNAFADNFLWFFAGTLFVRYSGTPLLLFSNPCFIETNSPFQKKDHLITMTQNLNHYEKILSRSHSNYLAQISIEMTEANNQINDVLSKLTALGTVLIPMNLVTGEPFSFFFFYLVVITNK